MGSREQLYQLYFPFYFLVLRRIFRLLRWKGFNLGTGPLSGVSIVLSSPC